MSVTVDPTVPPANENEGNGYVRIQNVAGWINALYGQSSSASFTYGTNPFTVDSSGNVNVTNGSGFTVGGNPVLATTQLYKGTDQVVSNGIGVNDSQLSIALNANDNWSGRFVLFISGPCSNVGIFPQSPAGGATWTFGVTDSALIHSGRQWITTASLQVNGPASLSGAVVMLEFPFTINNGTNAGTWTIRYLSLAGDMTVTAASYLFAFKVST